MKKLVSLVLALVLALGCMLPAMAETVEAPAAPFTFTLEDFKGWYNVFILSADPNITPVWTTDEDGLTAEADAQSMGKTVLTLNADGQVTKVSIETSLALDNLQLGAYNFGVSIAMATLSAKAAENPAFLYDTPAVSQMEADLTDLVNALSARANEALTGAISETGVIAGHTATVSMSFDLINMALVFGYTYEP